MIGLAGLCGLLTGLLMPWGRLLGPDASVFAQIGRMWLDGAMPYRDVILDKPPLLVPLSAAADRLGQLAGIGLADGVRLVSAASVLVLALVLARLLRRFGISRLISALVALAAVLFFADSFFSTGGGLSEPPALAIAMVAWWLAERSSRPLALISVGILAAVAIGISFLSAGLAAGVALAVLAKPGSPAQRARQAGLAALGGLAVLALVLAWLGSAGALGAMWHQLITYNSVYGAVSCPIADATGWPCWPPDQALGALFISGLILVSLALAAALSIRSRLPRSLGLRLAVILALSAVIAASTLRRVPAGHYWWPVIIGLLPLAAFGLDALWRWVRTSGPGGRARLAAVCGTALLAEQLLVPALVLSAYHGVEDPLLAQKDQQFAEIGRLIDAASPADAPLFVWSLYTQPYLVSRRPAAGLMVDLYGLLLPGYASADSYADACRLLAERRPVIYYDPDDLSLVPGAPTPAGIDPAWVAPLRALVASDWVLAGQIDGVSVLIPRPGVTPNSADCAIVP